MMKKAEISVVLWFQLFRALIAVFLIIAAINFCTKNTDAYEENFDKASELISSVSSQQNSNYQVSDFFVFEPERQMGVFFRGEPEFNYVAQYVKSSWTKKVVISTGAAAGQQIYYNPENNAITHTGASGVVVIDRPSTCGLNGCFCILTGLEIDSKLSTVLAGKEFDFDGEKISEYKKVNYENIACRNIDSPPATIQKIKTVKNVTKVVLINTGTSLQEGIDGKREATQEIINIGGTIMAPINSEAQIFYFSNDPQNNGFVVCKFEDEC